MAWIESHQELARHPKTLRVARALGISRVTVIGHLHFLWWWCLDYADDGSLKGLSDEEIAAAAEWDGDPEAFTLALTRAGFIEADDEGILHVHDWHDYAGKLVDQRQKNAEKQRRYRERKGNDTKTKRNVTVTSPSRNRATVPNRTVPNQTEPLGDTPNTPTSARPTSAPYAVYQAFCEAMDADEAAMAPAFKGKQLGVAKRLLDGGYTQEQIAACVLFMRRQEWRTSPFDLADVEKTIGKWLASGSPTHEAARASPNGAKPNGGAASTITGWAERRGYEPVRESDEGASGVLPAAIRRLPHG